MSVTTWPSPKNDQVQIVIFVHIPRTGGTTLNQILRRLYGDSAVLHVLGPRAEHLKRFQELTDEQKSQLRCVVGHMGFGFHELLSSPATYVTLLRHPVERVVSSYYYILRTPDHIHHQRLVSENMSLSDFVLAGVSKVASDNGQTRILSGAPEAGSKIPFRGCTRETLAAAERNLRQRFSVVGLTEFYDASLTILRGEFGWRLPWYRRENVGFNRPKYEPVSQETRDLIEEHNSLDMELYQTGVEMLQRQIRRQGPLFPIRLALFSFRNRRSGLARPN